MGGWLAFRPTKDGLVPLDGPVWDRFPLGSSRLPAALVDRRSEGVAGGKPCYPDWSQLQELKNEQLRRRLRQDHEKELAAIEDDDQREEKWKDILDAWEKGTDLP